jgi:hypothetical protein
MTLGGREAVFIEVSEANGVNIAGNPEEGYTPIDGSSALGVDGVLSGEVAFPGETETNEEII